MFSSTNSLKLPTGKLFRIACFNETRFDPLTLPPNTVLDPSSPHTWILSFLVLTFIPWTSLPSVSKKGLYNFFLVLLLFPDAVFCSWGEYDHRQFERDCKLHDVAWPFGDRHVNLKKLYIERFSLKRGEGFGHALGKHNLTFEGRPHRGIDDARNIVRMLPIIFEQ